LNPEPDNLSSYRISHIKCPTKAFGKIKLILKEQLLYLLETGGLTKIFFHYYKACAPDTPILGHFA
jgi:hypothetical protein